MLVTCSSKLLIVLKQLLICESRRDQNTSHVICLFTSVYMYREVLDIRCESRRDQNTSHVICLFTSVYMYREVLDIRSHLKVNSEY